MLKINSIDSYRSNKILDFKETIDLINKLKSQGKTVGLCHGGFDLLHPGHVKHLESSKKLCDFLFVSITSDKFVESRKGSGRPIFPDKLRAYMISSIGFIDYVVISDFKKGSEVIRSLKPSIYIKGPDFINKTTPGIDEERKAIEEVGGEIKYTNDPKLGTTNIIEYVKEKINGNNILIGIDRDGTLIKNDDFFGKNKDWVKEIEFNEDVINFLLYLQTKYKTTKIVITNQAGVAKRFFDCKRVEEINKYIDSELSYRGVKIDNWQYCPDVDSEYASENKDIDFNKDFVKNKTERKPSTSMLIDGLKELDKSLEQFDKIIIMGDRHEDEELAKNLNAEFIDVKNKSYKELIKKIDNS